MSDRVTFYIFIYVDSFTLANSVSEFSNPNIIETGGTVHRRDLQVPVGHSREARGESPQSATHCW